MTETIPADLQRLWDKEEIRSALYRYARGIDRRDYDLVRSAYHPDAHDDHGAYKGDVDGFIEWVSRRHATIEQSMHIICHTHVEFLADDVAVAESYVVCPQRYPAEARETIQAWVGDQELGPDERVRVVMYARFVDTFEKREGDWRIARRVTVIEEIDSSIVTVRSGSISRAQVRGPEDAIFEALRR